MNNSKDLLIIEEGSVSHSMVLCGTTSFWHVITSHVGKMAAPRPTPDTSV